ncbi:aminodeoxychorismate synthase component I [Nocardia takedensis]|uniref:aminodeoxychorismate synthase component I n=1 Tax=Nocardia takedensis TaxID=259390 RepID=UPI000313ACBF|nr:aminodeoxychorismate synthase component I [Nocardia takedensis]
MTVDLPINGAAGASLDPELEVAPVHRHAMVDISLRLPFHLYQQVFASASYSFLLDSAKQDARLGRYSFLGGDPYLVFQARRAAEGHPSGDVQVRLTDSSPGVRGPEVRAYRTGDVFGELAGLLDRLRVRPTSTAVPFTGGAVGYFGYEAAAFVEDVPSSGVDDIGAPDVLFMFVDSVLATCHETGRCYLSIVGRGQTVDQAEAEIARVRRRWLERIAHLEDNPPAPWTGPTRAVEPPPVWSANDRAEYGALVERAKEHIAAGDVFEVCLTHRLTSPRLRGSAWDLYRELRRINPAPFAAFLSVPGLAVVSSSPERFLRVDRDGRAESRPIKGTRRRTGVAEEDERSRVALGTAIKDRAENIMIVDLVRNDFGRVCEVDSVEVPELLVVEEYATVFQLVSTVVGRLRPGCTALDLVRSAFPGGSMTGAPKIESLKIIDSLERRPRGIYSGAIGYLDHSGHADFSIVIRTFVVKDGLCHFHVGGAIVTDSDPDGEYDETIDKARALVTALRNVQAIFAPEDGHENRDIGADFGAVRQARQ